MGQDITTFEVWLGGEGSREGRQKVMERGKVGRGGEEEGKRGNRS